MKALVFDKSYDHRKIIKNVIKNFHIQHEIVENSNHDELLFASKEEPFDLVILDIDYIGGNLLKTISNIRSQNPFAIIVVLTLFPEKLIREKLLDRGIDHYLDKVTQQNRLLEIIKSFSDKTLQLEDRSVDGKAYYNSSI